MRVIERPLLLVRPRHALAQRMLARHEQHVLLDRRDEDEAAVRLERQVIWREGVLCQGLPLRDGHARDAESSGGASVRLIKTVSFGRNKET